MQQSESRHQQWAQRDSNPRHLPCKSREFSAIAIDRLHCSHIWNHECPSLSSVSGGCTTWHNQALLSEYEACLDTSFGCSLGPHRIPKDPKSANKSGSHHLAVTRMVSKPELSMNSMMNESVVIVSPSCTNGCGLKSGSTVP